MLPFSSGHRNPSKPRLHATMMARFRICGTPIWCGDISLLRKEYPRARRHFLMRRQVASSSCLRMLGTFSSRRNLGLWRSTILRM